MTRRTLAAALILWILPAGILPAGILAAGSASPQELRSEQAEIRAPADLSTRLDARLSPTATRIIGSEGSLALWWWIDPGGEEGPDPSPPWVAPPGTLMAVVRLETTFKDLRGQSIPPGLYTARVAIQPPRKEHVGVWPRRDFLLLIAAADDPGGATPLPAESVIRLSLKAAGTRHPAVVGLVDQGDLAEGSVVGKEGGVQVLAARTRGVRIGVVVAGRAAGSEEL